MLKPKNKPETEVFLKSESVSKDLTRTSDTLPQQSISEVYETLSITPATSEKEISPLPVNPFDNNTDITTTENTPQLTSNDEVFPPDDNLEHQQQIQVILNNR